MCPKVPSGAGPVSFWLRDQWGLGRNRIFRAVFLQFSSQAGNATRPSFRPAIQAGAALWGLALNLPFQGCSICPSFCWGFPLLSGPSLSLLPPSTPEGLVQLSLPWDLPLLLGSSKLFLGMGSINPSNGHSHPEKGASHRPAAVAPLALGCWGAGQLG